MKRKGFTLMELLLVLGILAILSAIVLVAINPTKQLNDARGVSRSSAMREIENALSQYIIDGNTLTGLPAAISVAVDICQTAVIGTDCTDAPVSGYDLSALAPMYLTSLPLDPTQTGSTITGYRVYKSGSFNKVCSPVLDAGCGS
jgi:prepilin-type N-terminal cleavage/methylation domain-containing protein